MPDFTINPTVGIGRCQLFRPGHAAHPIQARVCWTPNRGVHEVELIEIGAHAIGIRDGDYVVRLLNHDIDKIRSVVLKGYESVFLASYDTLLTLGVGGGYISFSVKPDDGEPLEPCSHVSPRDTVAS